MLNANQKAVLNHLIDWYNGSNTFGVLHGSAGTGKTFLVQHLLKQLGTNCKPLLLAETNEAVNVLARSVKDQYPTKTVCSALNLHLTHREGEKVLVQRSQPEFEEVNFLLIDEASMLDKTRLDIIKELGIKTLYIGHKSQLPPVDVTLTTIDKCISPVFEENYPTFNLIEPVRNKGELATFCDKAESLIYQRGILEAKYTISNKLFDNYIKDDDTKREFKEGDTVCLAWTNRCVDDYNSKLRIALYGQVAIQNDFIVGDRIIFRSPTALFSSPVSSNHTDIETILAKTATYETVNTNTKGVVKLVVETTILGIPVYELFIETNHFDKAHTKGIAYVAVEDEKLALLKKKYYTSALYERVPAIADKKWRKYHSITTLFSNCKHGYAITVHCSQGSTIKNVLVDEKDISKCSNPYLRKKLKYVAYSRASNLLFRIS